MNTPRINLPRYAAIRSLRFAEARLLIAVLVVSTCARAQTDVAVDDQLQRIGIADNRLYALQRILMPKDHRTLVITSIDEPGDGNNIVKTPLVIGPPTSRMRAPSTRVTPQAFFLFQQDSLSSLKHASISAFSLDLLNKRITNPRLRESWDDFPPGHSFQLCKVQPAVDALSGFIELTDDGFKRGFQFHNPVVHCDFEAIDAEKIELFMTIDGRLSKWFYDGTEWHHKQTFKLQIEGSFMVLRGGNAVITERDGHWCRIENLKAEQPTVKRIVAKKPGEPLVLIEDLETKANYFEHEGKILSEDGAALKDLPSTPDWKEKTKAILDFVVSQRRK